MEDMNRTRYNSIVVANEYISYILDAFNLDRNCTKEEAVEELRKRLSSGVKTDCSEEDEVFEIIKDRFCTTAKREDVYIFKIKLADDLVDRDYECFDKTAILQMKDLFVGKHGFCGYGVSGRIVKTFTQTNEETGAFELWAYAYIIRESKSVDVIKEIETGIKKEVSISCCVKERVCSVCGNNFGYCGHNKKHWYGNNKCCYTILKGVTDVYEWAFVEPPEIRHGNVVGIDEEMVEYSEFEGKDSTVQAIEEQMESMNRQMKEIQKLLKELKEDA